jgi:hypothetical protein
MPVVTARYRPEAEVDVIRNRPFKQREAAVRAGSNSPTRSRFRSRGDGTSRHPGRSVTDTSEVHRIANAPSSMSHLHLSERQDQPVLIKTLSIDLDCARLATDDFKAAGQVERSRSHVTGNDGQMNLDNSIQDSRPSDDFVQYFATHAAAA